MKTINIKDYQINIYDGSVGVSLSGGADSAILSYILMSHYTHPIHFFTVASKEKNLITVKHSTNVIKKCIELTGNSNVFHHITYVEKQKRDAFFHFLIESKENLNLDIMHTSTTNVPETSILNSFSMQLSADLLTRRSPYIKKPLLSHNNKIYHPFANLNKKDIKSLYENLNVLEELFPLTRSCESTSEFNKHCQSCWWCQERFWAFGRFE